MDIVATVKLENPWGNEMPPERVLEAALLLARGMETQAQREAAGTMLIETAARRKALSTYITDKRRPFSEAADKISQFFAAATVTLNDADKALRDSIAAYDTRARAAYEAAQRAAEAQARQQRAELERMAEAQAAKGRDQLGLDILERAEAVAPAYVPPPPAAKGSTRKVWKARVTNQSAVPEAYKTVDMAALVKVAQATSGKAVIAGVEFYQDPSVVAR